MSKIIFMIRIIVCVVAFSSVCYADAYDIPLTIKCRPTVEQAGWKEVKGAPNKQYTLTSLGLEIAGETGPEEGGLFSKWTDHERGIVRYGVAHIIAKCTPNGEEMDMFPDLALSHDPLPTLVCRKGEGLAVRFLSPNDPDPNKYIYHGRVTITRDDPPPVRVQDVQTQGIRVNLPQMGLVPPGMMGGMGGMGGSSSGKPF